MPARGGQTLSSSGMAQKAACGAQNQRAYSEPYVSFIREGHVVGIGSIGTKPNGISRTQRSEQTHETSAHLDGGRVWGSAHPACPSLSPYGALLAGCTGLRISEVMGLRWTSINFENLVMEISEGFCSQPSHEAEVRVLAGRIASGSGRRDHSARMEATVPGVIGGIGFFPARGQTNPTYLARCERECSRARRREPRFRARSVGTRCVTATAPGSTKRVPLSGVQQKLHASCQHLDHDERLWRSLHGIEAQSQHIRRAARAASRPHQIAKGRHVDGLCSCASNLIGPFQTTIENPNSS